MDFVSVFDAIFIWPLSLAVLKSANGRDPVCGFFLARPAEHELVFTVKVEKKVSWCEKTTFILFFISSFAQLSSSEYRDATAPQVKAVSVQRNTSMLPLDNV